MKPYYEDGAVKIFHGDCREILPQLEPVDLVLTDPPYGITDHAWDKPIAPRLWMYSPTVCFAAEPYATALITGSPLPFKYDLVWIKNTATNLENCRIRPARTHERILLFGHVSYAAQKTIRTDEEMKRLNAQQRTRMEWSNPGSVLEFDAVNNRSGERTAHPSQKPLALIMWLLRSYSLDGNTILDPFMGSGTTLRAAKDLGRKAIGIEIEEKYCEIAARRMAQEVLPL